MYQKLDNFMFHDFDMEQGQFRRSWSYLFYMKYLILFDSVKNAQSSFNYSLWS